MDLHLAQAVAAGVAAACIGSAALAQPASSPSAARPAQSIPDVSPEAPAVAQAGGREVSTGDPDEDAVLAMVADVQAHAADILQRLRDGTMPCDAAWPPEKIEVFRRWTESGFPA